jgi:hypothetical protein
MKNQYFGDVNDFRKYGLLRQLCRPDKLTLGVCWMLTETDGRRDGEFRTYLGRPEKYRECDGELFDWLKEEVSVDGDRCVARIENTALLPNAIFYSRLLTDDGIARRTYFAECAATFLGQDLVFFDPDNGIEVGIEKGRRGSKKYVYWDELRQAFSAGSSVLIYQHFRREQRDAFIARMAQALQRELGAPGVFSFRTPHVLFLLAAQERHVTGFRELTQWIEKRWPPIRAKRSPQFVAQEHPISRP